MDAGGTKAIGLSLHSKFIIGRDHEVVRLQTRTKGVLWMW
jgi:hypothetical protein